MNLLRAIQTSPRRILLSCGLCLASLAQAGVLEWERSEQVFDTSCGQTVVEAVYPFRNASKRQLRILRTKSSCDCITVTVLPELCEAGAKGELHVTFKLGERVGEQRREILVKTDAAPDSVESVTIVVRIPEWITLTPRLLWWDRNSPAEEKHVLVKFADAKCGELLAIKSDNPDWEIRKSERKSGSDTQELWIRPRDTKIVSNADFALSFRTADQERILRLFTAVR